jgi:hypothetical protein
LRRFLIFSFPDFCSRIVWRVFSLLWIYSFIAKKKLISA